MWTLRSRGVLPAVICILLAILPFVLGAIDEPYYRDLAVRIMIFSIAAISLDIILGYGGMVSFGHAIYLGIGSYTVGILSANGVTDGFVHFGGAILISSFFALIIGLISLRASGVFFIMITLAFAQMVFYLAVSLSQYGGDDGLQLIGPSDFYGVIDLANPNGLYFFVFGMFVLSIFVASRIVHSHFGLILRGIQSNERRMTTLGYNCFLYKLAGFVIAGGLCGLGGALLANQSLFVSPAIMHWTRSGEIMAMVILGGIGTIVGPVLGAFVFLLAEDSLSGITQHWQVIFGSLLVLIVLFTNQGLYGLLPRQSGRRSSANRSTEPTACKVIPNASERQDLKASLETNVLVKSFGGIIATNAVSLKVESGEFHAIIGPNGAGKTTLIMQLAGELRPDNGTIRLGSEDVTRYSTQQRCRAGISRTFQITSVFREFTTLENVALAAQAVNGSGFRFWTPVKADGALFERASHILNLVGLTVYESKLVNELSQGDQRALEIALALATNPRVLLLDEPMAGMGSQDAERVISLLKQLKSDFTIVLVEHDMDAVFALADRISVLVYGEVIASGPPEAIAMDATVRDAYLGEQTVIA